MSAVDKIIVAEEQVAGLQSQLSVVESVLETAEHVAVQGEKAGHLMRRLFKIILLVSVVAAIVMIVKKVMGSRSAEEEAVVIDSGSAPVVAVAEVEAVEDKESSDEGTDAS